MGRLVMLALEGTALWLVSLAPIVIGVPLGLLAGWLMVRDP